MNTDKPVVSVIMPIYNVESFLAECLDSVLGQTLAEIEVICVNDGSTDSSLQIIEEYAAQDERIVVVDKPNGGYGQAVNCGLDRARGEWISIVEPDDIVDVRMYAELTALGETPSGPADIVKGSYWLYFHFDGRSPYVERPNLMNCMPQGICEVDVWENPELLKHHPSIWSAVYRRGFIEEQGIRMIEPKGAGWADNPWFFHTMLAAKRIIWSPKPCYKYRQTNPDASSKLKDFHLPFERLRDIRAIYEQHHVTNRKMLIALYQRSFDYICTSLLEEFGFAENDPKMQQLTREVFDSFDPQLVLDETTPIPQRRKDYYKDVMGIYLDEVEQRPRCTHPRISFVVAMSNDRRGLWETLRSLLGQSFADFEVICVDCQSPDRSLQIAQAVAERDGRVSVLGDCSSVAQAYGKGLQAAKGDYVHFLRPGVVFENRRVMRNLVRSLDSFGGVIDVVIYRYSFPPSRLLSRQFEFGGVCMQVEGIRADVHFAARPNLFTRLFGREFLLREGIRFDQEGDPDGWSAAMEASCRMSNAAFACVEGARAETKEVLERESMRTEDEFISFALARYDAISNVADRLGSREAAALAKGCIACGMAEDIALVGRYRSGEAYFEALRHAYTQKYRLDEVPSAPLANYLDFGVLEEAFSLPYEEYVKKLLTRRQVDAVELVRQRDRAERRVRRMETSGSYMFGEAAGKVAKAVVPKNLIRSTVDASVERNIRRK